MAEAAAGAAAAAATFSVRTWRMRPGAPAVPYAQPREVGTFFKASADADPVYGGYEGLRAYHEPTPGVDLSSGIDDFVFDAPTSDLRALGAERRAQFSLLLRVIEKSPVKVTAQPVIVSWRGVMTRLMATPCARGDAWRIVVQRRGDHLLMDLRPTADELAQRGAMTPEHRCAVFMGYKFESVCSATPDEAVDRTREFCYVFRTKLGAHRLVLGAEVDAYEALPSAPSDRSPARFVELKTAKLPVTERAHFTHARYRLLKMFLQSFLAGVPTILVGYREGTRLVEVERLRTLHIPRSLPKHMRGAWSSNTCLAFANDVLAWLVRETAARGDGVYECTYASHSSVLEMRAAAPHTYGDVDDAGCGQLADASFRAFADAHAPARGRKRKHPASTPTPS